RAVWDESIAASSRCDSNLHEIRRQEIEARRSGRDEADLGHDLLWPQARDPRMLYRFDSGLAALLQGDGFEDIRREICAPGKRSVLSDGHRCGETGQKTGRAGR